MDILYGTHKVATYNKWAQAESNKNEEETGMKIKVDNISVNITPAKKYSTTEQEIKKGNLRVGKRLK